MNLFEPKKKQFLLTLKYLLTMFNYLNFLREYLDLHPNFKLLHFIHNFHILLNMHLE